MAPGAPHGQVSRPYYLYPLAHLLTGFCMSEGEFQAEVSVDQDYFKEKTGLSLR